MFDIILRFEVMLSSCNLVLMVSTLFPSLFCSLRRLNNDTFYIRINNMIGFKQYVDKYVRTAVVQLCCFHLICGGWNLNPWVELVWCCATRSEPRRNAQFYYLTLTFIFLLLGSQRVSQNLEMYFSINFCKKYLSVQPILASCNCLIAGILLFFH